jgi:hypothetical protein
MATKAEVRNLVLTGLGVLRLGQDPQNQDSSSVETAYDQVYARLKELGLATWASTGEVPDALVPHVRDLVALECATSLYGISNERMNRIMLRAGASGENAERELRRLTTPRYESADDPCDY